MRSEAQIEASRQNGATSQGPITEEGKQRSRLNAVKYGLSARTVVLCNESHALFEQLEDDYLETFQPCSIPELHLVQRMVAADWRLHRAQVVATAIKDKSIFDHKAQDDRENANCDNDYRLGINQVRIAEDLSSVQRAEAGFERAHARALAELVAVRKLRPAGAQPIQLDRHYVTTTGRDPAQYLGLCGAPEPKPDDPKPPEPNSQEPNPPENASNEPKPPTPAESEQVDSDQESQQVEPEPCIIIPYYQKFEEEPTDNQLPLLPDRRLVS